MVEVIFKVIAGFFSGGFIGWVVGLAWYFLIEVPYAERAVELAARDSYLCAAGNALPLLAVPGAIIGAIAALLKAYQPSLKEDLRDEV